jgi:hypothetical protein
MTSYPILQALRVLSGHNIQLSPRRRGISSSAPEWNSFVEALQIELIASTPYASVSALAAGQIREVFGRGP